MLILEFMQLFRNFNMNVKFTKNEMLTQDDLTHLITGICTLVAESGLTNGIYLKDVYRLYNLDIDSDDFIDFSNPKFNKMAEKFREREKEILFYMNDKNIH